MVLASPCTRRLLMLISHSSSFVSIFFTHNNTLAKSFMIIALFGWSSAILCHLCEINRTWWNIYSPMRRSLWLIILVLRRLSWQRCLPVSSSTGSNEVVCNVYGWGIYVVDICWLNWICHCCIKSTYLRRTATRSTIGSWVLSRWICSIRSMMRYKSLWFWWNTNFAWLIIGLTILFFHSLVSVTFWRISRCARRWWNSLSEPLFGSIAYFSLMLIGCSHSWSLPTDLLSDYGLIGCACTFLSLSDCVRLISFIGIFFFNWLFMSP